MQSTPLRLFIRSLALRGVRTLCAQPYFSIAITLDAYVWICMPWLCVGKLEFLYCWFGLSALSVLNEAWKALLRRWVVNNSSFLLCGRFWVTNVFTLVMLSHLLYLIPLLPSLIFCKSALRPILCRQTFLFVSLNCFSILVLEYNEPYWNDSLNPLTRVVF